MRTVLTNSVDGHEIIIGFDEALIDPAKTKAVVQPLLEASQEWTDVGDAKKYLETEIATELKAAENKFRALLNVHDRKVAEASFRESNEYKNWQDLEESYKSNLNQKIEALKAKREEIFADNVVYFQPKIGEEIIEDSEYNTLKETFNNLSNNYLLKRDGTEIVDNRGKIYWIYEEGDGLWSSHNIASLGVDKEEDSFWAWELTSDQLQEIAAQKENERIESLSTEEIEVEKKVALNNALAEAAVERSKLEIMGEVDALEQSQTWYNNRVAEIEEKYSSPPEPIQES